MPDETTENTQPPVRFFRLFTDGAQKMLQSAHREAERLNHQYVGPEHILLALLQVRAGFISEVFKNIGIEAARVRSEIEQVAPMGVPLVSMGKLPETPLATRVIELAIEDARGLGEPDINETHLLLGLLRLSEGPSAQVLTKLGASVEKARANILESIGYGEGAISPGQSPSTPGDAVDANEVPSVARRRYYFLAERFTDRARKVMHLANHEGARLGQLVPRAELVMLGLIREGSGVAANVLMNMGVDFEAIRLEVEKLLESGSGSASANPSPQHVVDMILDYAAEEARGFRHNYIGSEHILLGLLRDEEGGVAQVLSRHGVDAEKVRNGVLSLLGCGVQQTERAHEPATIRVEPNMNARCSNNLKTIALALHRYHDRFGTFPPAYQADGRGEPVHSWRVLLLPFLGEENLHREYRFDETWDGPHNRKLVEQMPAVFRCPADVAQSDAGCRGLTSYLAVVGAHTSWKGPDGVKIGEISNGMAKTLHVVEVANSGIMWLEPRDLHVVQMSRTINAKTGQGMSSRHPGGAHGLLCDGSVKFFPAQLSQWTLGEWFRAID